MLTLSVQQPWAYAILHLGKRIENRSRIDGRLPAVCSHRGPLLLHASATYRAREFDAAATFIMGANQEMFGDLITAKLLAPRQAVYVPTDKIPFGGIVGRVTVTGACYTDERGHRFGVEATTGYNTAWDCVLCGGKSPGCRDHDCPHADPWAVRGSYGLLLADPVALPFVAWEGRQGLFDMPESALEGM